MAVSLNVLLTRSKNNMASGTHPVVRDSALEMIRRAYKEGIYVQISEGYRSNARQNELYSQGRTKPGNVVTNARAGQSWHNYGIAVDFFLTSNDGKKAIWTVNAKWRRAAQIGKQLGFEWGGDWKSFKDYPHLQMTGGLSLSQLQAGRKPKLKRKFGKPTSNIDSNIKKLQQDLKSLGYNPGKIDGIDGKNTKKAVREFQKAEGLTVDGIAGKKTKAKIKHIKNGGMTLSEYKKVMKKINSLENKLNKKVSVPNKTNTPSDSHKDGWQFVKNNNISNGTDAHGYVTRQQLATMLKKYDDIRFSDKKEPSESHEIAWQWLVDIGVTNGIDPRKPLTREQFASLLMKYNESVELKTEDVAYEIYDREIRRSRARGE